MNRIVAAALAGFLATAPLAALLLHRWLTVARHGESIVRRRFVRRAVMLLSLAFPAASLLVLFRGSLALPAIPTAAAIAAVAGVFLRAVRADREAPRD